MAKPFNYGGQAVMEGVMMRGSKHMAVAVRAPYGYANEALKALKEQYPALNFVETGVDVTTAAMKLDRAEFTDAVAKEGKVFAIKVSGDETIPTSDISAMKALIVRTGAPDSEAFTVNADQTITAYDDGRMAQGILAVIAGIAEAGAGDVVLLVADTPRIIMHEEPISSPLYNGVWAKVPFVRGLGLLWDSLGLGLRALMWSANVAVGEEAEFGGPIAWGTIAVSFAFSISLFFLLPAAAADGLHTYLGVESPLLGNLIEGVIRLSLIIAYIWLTGRLSDIQRVYAYHGAEHKAINAYEDGAPLTPESVQRYPLEHPRCGTGFLLVVMVVSILVFSLLGRPHIAIRLLSRVVLIPVIAGIAYEYIRLLARNLHNPIARILVKPQLLLQRLTTREPSLDMLEVSIAALKRVLEVEKIEVAAPAADAAPVSVS